MVFLCRVPAVVGMLYAEEKERLDFVYTIYHWWQAIAIFIVYLWSHFPMRVGTISFGVVLVSFFFGNLFKLFCLLGQALHPVGHLTAGLLLLLGDGAPHGAESAAPDASHPSAAAQGDRSQALRFNASRHRFYIRTKYLGCR